VCHVTLPGNNFWLSIAVQVYERHCVCLRPAIVDHVLAPTAFATRCLLLLKPENAVVMAQTGEQVRKFVAIDVHCKNEPGCAKFEFRVKAPFFISPIERRFKPALGSDDIRAPISIDVARPDAMPIAVRADFVIDPFGVRTLPNQFIPR
jgi:hypothetical protein